MKALERKYSKVERIVAKGKFSAWYFWRTFLVAFILGGILAVVWIFKDQIEGVLTKQPQAVFLTDGVMKWALLGCGIIVVIVFIVQLVRFEAKELLLTEDKIVYREGISSVKTVVIPLNEIKIVETNQRFFQRITGVCDMQIVSDAGQPYKIENIRSADRLTRRIMKQISIVRTDMSGRAMIRLVGNKR